VIKFTCGLRHATRVTSQSVQPEPGASQAAQKHQSAGITIDTGLLKLPI
jgi:hypothetical protein